MAGPASRLRGATGISSKASFQARPAASPTGCAHRTWAAAGTSPTPTRFGPVLGPLDDYLVGEGTHRQLYDRLGAHPIAHEGTDGVHFAVWAPQRPRVSVVGDFNAWDGRRHPMRKRVDTGVWEIFVPGVGEGTIYKYEIIGPHGKLLPLKADPFGFGARAAAVDRLGRRAGPKLRAGPTRRTWRARQGAGRAARADVDLRGAPRLVAARRRAAASSPTTSSPSELIPYAVDMGFTHLELLPVNEHPLDASWGYQPIGLFAPTRRFGEPAGFARFVDGAQRAGLGVILDWVPAHFPTDPHGLAQLRRHRALRARRPAPGLPPRLEHRDLQLRPPRGRQLPHRQRAVLARPLPRRRPARRRGRLDALPRLLAQGGRVAAQPRRRQREPRGDRASCSEPTSRSTARTPARSPSPRNRPPGPACRSRSTPAASASASSGTWAGCTTRSTTCRCEPVHRRWHHDEMTFGLLYAFTENFVLPLSHDEVVHGKGSLLAQDAGRRLAAVRQPARLLRASCGRYPGKKLLFMGQEFAQGREWNFDAEPRLAPARRRRHRGVQALVRDCNRALPRRSPRCTRATARARASAGSSSTTRTTRCSRGCVGAGDGAAGRGDVAISRRCRAQATVSACRCRAAGARSSTPTPAIYGGSGMRQSRRRRCAAKRTASHGFPASRRT